MDTAFQPGDLGHPGKPVVPYSLLVSMRRPGRHQRVQSRAELALGELCTRLGYCLPSDITEVILASRPPDAESFVNAVLVAEGREPLSVAEAERDPMLSILAKWAVYELPDGAVAERPAFPRSS